MFSTLLRRPRPVRRRVESLDQGRASASIASPSFAPSRRIPTADFTEDDDDVTEHNIPGVGRSARFVDPGDEDGNGEEEDEEEEEDDDGGEDGRRGALPVLPLFSTTHLGSQASTGEEH